MKRTTIATVIDPASLTGVFALPVSARQAFVPLKETSLCPSGPRAIVGPTVVPAYPDDMLERTEFAIVVLNFHVLLEVAPLPSFSGHSVMVCPSVCVSDSASHVAVAAGTVSVDGSGGAAPGTNASTP